MGKSFSSFAFSESKQIFDETLAKRGSDTALTNQPSLRASQA